MFDAQSPSRKGPDVARTSDSTPRMRKASSSVNIVDDLSSIFGGANMGTSWPFFTTTALILILCLTSC